MVYNNVRVDSELRCFSTVRKSPLDLFLEDIRDRVEGMSLISQSCEVAET